MSTFGAIDEQSPAFVGWRALFPSELDRAVKAMVVILKDYFPGADVFNWQLWGLVGWVGGPVEEFVRNYMMIARQKGEPVTFDNRAGFEAQTIERQKLNPEQTGYFYRALMDAQRSGLISDIIYRPYTASCR